LKLELNLNEIKIDWKNIYATAIGTEGKTKVKEPSTKWKRKILISEHSPIRKGEIDATWKNIMSWVSVHFVRHKFGIEHFVKTQRTDRTGVDRNELKQSQEINHNFIVNIQAIIYISRKRKCFAASKETIEAWSLFLESFRNIEPELYSVCVPECIYRGFCPEFKSCGYVKTEDFEKKKIIYRNV